MSQQSNRAHDITHKSVTLCVYPALPLCLIFDMKGSSRQQTRRWMSPPVGIRGEMQLFNLSFSVLTIKYYMGFTTDAQYRFSLAGIDKQ